MLTLSNICIRKANKKKERKTNKHKMHMQKASKAYHYIESLMILKSESNFRVKW